VEKLKRGSIPCLRLGAETPIFEPMMKGFEEDLTPAATSAEHMAQDRLLLDLDGFEGPLDVLLDLARRDKLDLKTISILDLADQYLAFIQAAQHLHLELAGDYLVMAAWLAYLKSRLLLPKRADDLAPEAERLMEDLTERLRRLEAVRRAGANLSKFLGASRESLPRGAGERVIASKRQAWDTHLIDLLGAYAERRQAQSRSLYRIEARKVLSIVDARNLLEKFLGHSPDWRALESVMGAIFPHATHRRSAYASSFVALLELAREGKVALKQDKAFEPLYLRDPRAA
jgi:segregation and condensation protein A